MADPIRVDEWMAELQRLEDRKPDGFTSAELAQAMGCSIKTALLRLNRLAAAGSVVHAGERTSRTVSGRRCLTPVYRRTDKG